MCPSRPRTMFWIGILSIVASLAYGQSECPSDIPCEGGAICQDVPFDSSSLPLDPQGNVIVPDGVPTQAFSCDCPNDRTGLYCEHRMQVCTDRYVCYHGGQCFNRTDGSFLCDCTQASDNSGQLTVGSYCEEFVPNSSNCSDNPNAFCLSRGTCSQAEDKDLNPCICNDQYTGRNCEFWAQELPSCDLQCGDNGVCRYGFKALSTIDIKLGVPKTEDGLYCECRSGFHGSRCDVDQPTTCDDGETVCVNGATCIIDDATGGYKCDCESTGAKVAGSMCQYFASDTCENPQIPQSEPNDPQPNGGFCTNQGTCYQSDASFTFCGCVGGFQGPHCEYLVGTAAPSASAPAGNSQAPALQYPTSAPKPAEQNGTYSPTITWQPSRTPYPTRTPHPSTTAFPSKFNEGAVPGGDSYPTAPPRDASTPYPSPDPNDDERSETPEDSTRNQDDFTSTNASLEDELKKGAKAGIAVAVVIVTIFGLFALRQRRQTVVRHQNLARANFEAEAAGDNWQSSMALTEDNEKGVELI